MILTVTEKIIGDNVKIMVVRIKGKQVKFGINTPYKISVLREYQGCCDALSTGLEG